MVKRIIAQTCVLLSILVLCVSVHAQEQNNLSINFRVGMSQGLGYENPRLGGELSLKEMLSRHMGGTFSAAFDSARKRPGGGHAESLQGTFRYYADKFFVGGGIIAYRQDTSAYSKTGASPLIEVGTINKALVVRATLEPYDFLSPNHSIAGGLGLDYYAPTRKSYGWKIGFNSRIARFGCFQGAHGLTSSCVGGSASFSFGIYRKIKRAIE